MNLGELVTEVLAVVDDARYTESNVKTLVNEAVYVVASGRMYGRRFRLSPPLPNLYTSANVETVAGEGVLPLPDNFNRDVIQVVNADHSSLPIMPSIRGFLKLNTDQAAGPVSKCAVQGNRLFYRDIPATPETLTVHFYENPTELAVDTDIPDCIPIQLHRPLIISYVCMQIYNKLEMGMAGPKVDTLAYGAIFQEGLIQLQGLLPADGNPVYYETEAEAKERLVN